MYPCTRSRYLPGRVNVHHPLSAALPAPAPPPWRCSAAAECACGGGAMPMSMTSCAGDEVRDEDEADDGRGMSGAEGEPASLRLAVDGGEVESDGSRTWGTLGEAGSVGRADEGAERLPSLRFTDDKRRDVPAGREGIGSWWAGPSSSSESSSVGRLRAHAASPG